MCGKTPKRRAALSGILIGWVVEELVVRRGGWWWEEELGTCEIKTKQQNHLSHFPRFSLQTAPVRKTQKLEAPAVTLCAARFISASMELSGEGAAGRGEGGITSRASVHKQGP